MMALPQACRESLEKYLQPELFRALCDPQRISLLSRLATATAPMTVTDAASCCGVHISGVSRHLAMLKQAGVVSANRAGRQVHYAVDFDALIDTLRGLADALEECRETSTQCT